jgi:hypothetical protein
MSKTHNKKRNVGIIYEQLVRRVSEALVAGDTQKADKIMGILRRHFDRDSQLYREFRLFNALVKTTVPSESLATRILTEAKEAAKDHDALKLRQEKAALVRDINHTLNDKNFYKTRVEGYRTYATIQTLLNDWRADLRLGRVIDYERKIHEWLLTDNPTRSIDELKTPGVNPLTVKIMTDKFNQKYGRSLTSAQKEIIQEYAFSKSPGRDDIVRGMLTRQKDELLRGLSSYARECSNKILLAKIPEVREKITTLDLNEMSDTGISRFLVLAQLGHEIMEGEDE